VCRGRDPGTGTARARIESLDGRDRVERCQLEGVLDARGTVCNGWCSLRRHEQTITGCVLDGLHAALRTNGSQDQGLRTHDLFVFWEILTDLPCAGCSSWLTY
jgi:hypothetical protein